MMQNNRESGKITILDGGTEPIKTKKTLPSEDGKSQLDRGERRSRLFRPRNHRRVTPDGRSPQGLNRRLRHIGLSHTKRTPGASAVRRGKGVARGPRMRARVVKGNHLGGIPGGRPTRTIAVRGIRTAIMQTIMPVAVSHGNFSR